MMLLLIFQGYGFIALLIPAICYLCAWFLGANPAAMAVVLLAAAACVWIVGVRMNREEVIRTIGFDMGAKVRLTTRRNTVFHAPMQYVAIPLAAYALYQWLAAAN